MRDSGPTAQGISAQGISAPNLLIVLASHSTVGEHRRGDLGEARQIRSIDVVHMVTPLAVSDAFVVNVLHDRVQLGIDFFVSPGQAERVLALLQS